MGLRPLTAKTGKLTISTVPEIFRGPSPGALSQTALADRPATRPPGPSASPQSFQRIDGGAPDAHHVADGLRHAYVVGYAEPGDEIWVGFTPDECVFRRDRDRVAAFHEHMSLPTAKPAFRIGKAVHG